MIVENCWACFGKRPSGSLYRVECWKRGGLSAGREEGSVLEERRVQCWKRGRERGAWAESGEPGLVKS